ncbi:cbb3-type cytochrome c oxidase N-terminal domain-containing protein [Mucilaginibacter ginkgonis]|uniref:C-type cytochrome n=1 Tax=Mucilaginibacter ginkgonis TaxID=2682091 RepID=A0A6I4HZ61_9SPHI|nr:cbb3-type cytochrome c oxidase N-terminal domain-containing protein [Mucilaginibacter ginkgonis]QQL50247.1 c-type cytochrome [Mucilaginibacter ginkgonis]
MKYSRTFLTSTIALFSMQPTMAKDDSLLSGETVNYIGYGVIMLTLVLCLIAFLVINRAFRVVIYLVLKQQGMTAMEIEAEMNPGKVKKAKKPKGEVWQKLLSLKPMAQEKEILIEHDYDGIQELDNPIPAWFMYLFYATILFAVGYLLNYHVFMTGPLQYAEYRNEMAQAAIEKKAYLSKTANQVDENTVKLNPDASVLAAGGTTFRSTCAPCHGDHAQGNVGPNLTDDYCLHGGKINDIFKTIKYGVLAKGMPTWEKQLSPKQISDVANYIISLHGSNPANPKPPQGTKEIQTTNKLALAK